MHSKRAPCKIPDMTETESSKANAPELTVVAPVYNENECLPLFQKQLDEILEKQDISYEVILVDDGSTDGSRKLIAEFAESDERWRGIFLARNFGHQAAITAGIDNAKGKKVVVMDSDLQDSPDDIPKLLKKMDEGYDVVCARRARRSGNPLLRLSYWFFYRFLARVSETRIPLDVGDFACMDRKVVDALKSFPERNRFVRGLRAWAGFRQTGIDVKRAKRAGGKQKYTFRKLFRLAADAAFSFSWVPLRLVSLTGALSVLASLVYLAVILVMYFTRDINIQGWTTIVFLIVAFGGATLLALGIIGEYLGRIYDEVKKRPIYIIADSTDEKKDS